MFGETEKYVEANNFWAGVILRTETRVLSLQVETTDFHIQNPQ